MPSYIQIADKLKSELQRHKAFAEAAEIFERLGSIEQAEDEARQRLVKTQNELDAYEKSLAHLKATAGADVDSAKAEAQNIRSVAHKDAENARNDARIECDKWRDKARADAQKLVADATKDADGIASKAAKDASQWLLAAENARSQAEGLAKQVADKSAELAAIEGKIFNAKAAMAKMLGA